MKKNMKIFSLYYLSREKTLFCNSNSKCVFKIIKKILSEKKEKRIINKLVHVGLNCNSGIFT